jgi:HAD superfamily hydrolase (TIGR01509 family)
LIDNIIFDMDGVLFDSEPLHTRFEQSLFKKLNIELSEMQKQKLIGLGDLKMWEMISELFIMDHSLNQLLENDRKERIKFFSKKGVTVMAGAEKLLASLTAHGFRLALASSSQMEIIDLNLSRAGFSHYFEVKVSNDMVISGKPEPDIFLFAAERMKVLPQNCLVIEDSENGVNAAKSAGMKCIAYSCRPVFKQNVAKADLIVDDLLKITPELIKSLN